jgi:hypothetical protein
MSDYSPFSSGFGGFQFDNPFEESEEEKRKRELEEAEVSSLRASMDTEPSWDDPAPDVSGRLPDDNPRGSVTDTVKRGLDVAEGEGGQDYLEQYAEHIGNRPQKDDYDHSTGNKILSIIGGIIGGPGLHDRIKHGKYQDDYKDWYTRGQGLGKVAELEQKHGSSRRTLGGNVITADTKRAGDVEDFETSERDRGSREKLSADQIASREGISASEIASREGISSADREVDVGNLQLRAQELQQRVANETDDNKRADAQLELDKTKAEISRITAEASASRAATYDKSVGDVDSPGSLIWDRAQGPDPSGADLTPDQAFAAKQMAIRNVIEQNPEWGEFYTDDGLIMDEGWIWDGPAPEEMKQAVREEMERMYPGSVRQTRGPLGDVAAPGGE